MKMHRTNCRKRSFNALSNLGQEEMVIKPKMESEAEKELDIELDDFETLEVSQTEKENTHRMKMNHINCRNRTYMPLPYLEHKLPSEREVLVEEPEPFENELVEPEPEAKKEEPEPVEAEPMQEPEEKQEEVEEGNQKSEQSKIEQHEEKITQLINHTKAIELLEKIHSLREEE